MVQELARKLIEKNLSICSAESLTGGLFGASISDISGISKVYKGSLVTYQDQAKIDVLRVKESTIQNFGALSLECAYEMVKNVQKMFNSDIAVSFTGNAGPTGSEGKPVGLVYIGVYFLGEVEIIELNLKGTREEIRNECLRVVSNKILRKIEKN